MANESGLITGMSTLILIFKLTAFMRFHIMFAYINAYLKSLYVFQDFMCAFKELLFLFESSTYMQSFLS